MTLAFRMEPVRVAIPEPTRGAVDEAPLWHGQAVLQLAK